MEKKEIKQSGSLLNNNEPTSFSLEIKHKHEKLTKNKKLYLIWTIVRILYLNIRFFLNPVQIFMQTIQQKSQKFLWILLLVSWKLRSEFPYLYLYSKA